ncbi:MAG: tyrosine-type recombinase/integrase [Candidatus Melainabacteria bacterium]|nr:tyrosine-type recombinase/integrase [Candidatus Melainabacteria bacterium]
MHQYLTAAEVAKDLGIPTRTVQNYCRTGFLPARITYYKNRKQYSINSDTYYKWKSEHFSGLKKGQANKYTSKLKELSLDGLQTAAIEWLDWCQTGKLTGKPLSPRTVEIYDTYFRLYLKTLGKYPSKPLVSVNNLREVLGSFAPERYSTKRNIYDAIMSLSKYLIEKEMLDTEVRDKMKSLKPRRFVPPKRTSLTETQLEQMYQAVEAVPYNREYDRIIARTLITFLVNTGLRAAECCRLKLDEVDLEARRVHVNLGKGNKNRIVGINDDTFDVLVEYLKMRLKFSGDSFFINRLGRPLTVDRIERKVTTVAKRAGLKGISPHSLRRSFVTINAGKGKPLNHLRIACGHSDISTTQGYCMTSVDEVVEAMKGW